MGLRIAHVSTQRGWHGGEQQLELLVEGLKARGYENLVVARSGGEVAPRMSAAGYAVAAFDGGGRSPRAVWQIRRQLLRWRPDVLHFHDGHALSGGGLAAWRLPIAARIASRKVAFPIRHAWRYHRFADRVICVSQAVADVCTAGGVGTDRLRVVYDGVAPQRAAAGDRTRGRQSLNVANDRYLLVCVASLVATKGLEYLLAGLPRVRALHPHVQLAVAGDGPLRAALEQQAQELQLQDSIHWLGYRHDVPDLLQAADLFVLPSILEGMCSTLVDVMFARRPIVATAVGGVPEVLSSQAGESDYASLVAPSNADALASAICRSIERPEDLTDQVERAYRRAHERFTADCMVEGTLEVYREALARHAAA